jgi:hypothetical protein
MGGHVDADAVSGKYCNKPPHCGRGRWLRGSSAQLRGPGDRIPNHSRQAGGLSARLGTLLALSNRPVREAMGIAAYKAEQQRRNT